MPYLVNSIQTSIPTLSKTQPFDRASVKTPRCWVFNLKFQLLNFFNFLIPYMVNSKLTSIPTLLKTQPFDRASVETPRCPFQFEISTFKFFNFLIPYMVNSNLTTIPTLLKTWPLDRASVKTLWGQVFNLKFQLLNFQFLIPYMVNCTILHFWKHNHSIWQLWKPQVLNKEEGLDAGSWLTVLPSIFHKCTNSFLASTVLPSIFHKCTSSSLWSQINGCLVFSLKSASKGPMPRGLPTPVPAVLLITIGWAVPL